MKCRRSSGSRGAKLRGPHAEAPSQAAEPKAGTAAAAAIPSASSRPGSNLQLDARTEGPVHHTGTLTIGLTGSVIGNVYATTIVLEGEVIGDLHAAQALRVGASGRLTGDMYTPRVAIARGAQLRGNISMPMPQTPTSDLNERAVDALLSGSQRA